MKNILFLINNLGEGGAEKVLVNLVNNIDKKKYDITLRALIDYGQNKKYLSKAIKYEYVFNKGFRGINYLHLLPSSYIFKKVTNGNFDVIVVYLHGVLTKIVSKAPKNQKTIAYLHADMLKSPFIKGFSNKNQILKCFKSYDAIVSVSKSVQDSFVEVTGIKEKLHVLYNTFDVNEINIKSKKPIDTALFNSSVLTMCSVGSLTKVKGFERLLHVLNSLKEDGFKFKLLIIGEGYERKKLKKFIEENNLNDYIFLIGYKSNPYKFIANSDLFICSSFSEGFSSVVVESIILGVPVLTTSCSGMSEILGKNGEFGMIVENNEKGIYFGLRELMSNIKLREYYEKKAIERASFFSTRNTIKEVEKLIDNII